MALPPSSDDFRLVKIIAIEGAIVILLLLAIAFRLYFHGV